MNTQPTPTIPLDVSGLLPPEPMEQILEALAAMAPQQRLLVLIDREPHPLYKILDRHGYGYRTSIRADHRFDLLIQKIPCNDP